MKIILLLLAFSTLNAKEFKVNYTDCYNVKYIDTNDDATFDSLIIDDCGTILKLKLSSSMTAGKPTLEQYNNAEFEIALKNYNYIRNDAYFQIRVFNQSQLIGYWQHIMGSNKLEWKSNINITNGLKK